MSLRVAITTGTFDSADGRRRMADLGIEVVENPFGRRLSEAESSEFLSDVVGVLAGTSPLTRVVLESAPGLRVISRCGVGVDNIDFEAASAAGIIVRTAPGSLPQSVAELAVAMMLNLLRHIGEADRNVRQGEWGPLMGHLLGGKTVGIVGVGRIGTRVARLLRSFDCRLLGTDPTPPPDETLAALGIRMLPLDDLLEQCDIVTLHTPYSSETHLLLDRSRLARLPRGSYVVNTARGGLVDEEALTEALRSGALAGAGLDTFLTEPYDGPLRFEPRCLLTCHMGSYAAECREAMEREAVENLIAGLEAAGVLQPASDGKA